MNSVLYLLQFSCCKFGKYDENIFVQQNLWWLNPLFSSLKQALSTEDFKYVMKLKDKNLQLFLAHLKFVNFFYTAAKKSQFNPVFEDFKLDSSIFFNHEPRKSYCKKHKFTTLARFSDFYFNIPHRTTAFLYLDAYTDIKEK